MTDRATVIGLAGMVCLLVWVLVAGAGTSAVAFWRTPSVALVVGGSVLATIVAFPAARIRSLGPLLKNVFVVGTPPLMDSLVTLVALATVARRDGLLGLERPVDRLDDEFLKKGIRMVIDGVEPSTIQSILATEVESTDLRHAEGRGLLESMARFAPVFGMIGTIIGLVIMLGKMEDPTRIGPGMAVAMLTTLYGLVLANVFCLPMARKLGHRTRQEMLHMKLVVEGVMAIQAGDHPRLVEHKLRAYLPNDSLVSGVAQALGRHTARSIRPEPPQAEDPFETPRTGPPGRHEIVEAA